MDHDYVIYSVPIKNLEKSHDLPPQSFFSKAQGVLQEKIEIKIKPEHQYDFKALGSLPFYFVIDSGYLFIYKSASHGYAIKIREGDWRIFKTINDGSNCLFLSHKVKDVDIKFEFNYSLECTHWRLLLNDVANPKITEEEVQMNARKHPKNAFKKWLKSKIVAIPVPRESGQKGETERVYVYRCPTEEEPAAPTLEERKNLVRLTHWPWLSPYSGAAAIETPQQPGAGVPYAHPTSAVVDEEEKEDMLSSARVHLSPPNNKTPTCVPPSQKRAHQEGKTPVPLANGRAMRRLQFINDDTAIGRDMEAQTTTTATTTSSSSASSSSTMELRSGRKIKKLM